MKRFHAGLIRMIATAATVLLPAHALADQLTLYFFPAPRPLSWINPRELAISAAANSFLPHSFTLAHPIGHAAVRLKCRNTEVLTGMSDADDDQMNDAILKDGEGLGVLFETFSGRLQSAEEIQNDIDERAPRGRVASVAFQLRASTCDRLMEYYGEYVDRGVWRRYGLPLRPRYGEGAGCSAFAISFLDLAGLLKPEYSEKWTRSLKVPRGLIKEQGGKVSLWTLLFSVRSWLWGSDDSNSREIDFWDPQNAYDWIVSNPDAIQNNLDYDSTSVETPTDPIWLKK